MATLVAVHTQGFLQNTQALCATALRSTPISHDHPSSSAIELAEYVPMVRAVARRMHRTLPRHIELDDVISAGYLGLVDAAQKFEQSRQIQFRSYAEFRVRGAILDSLRDLDGGSRGLRRKVRDIENARQTLTATLAHAPEDAEIASKLGISLSDLQETLAVAHSVETESLQAERDDADGHDLLATLVDSSAPDALAICLEGEFKQALVDAIDALPERERLIITLSYYEELTLKEIGDMLSLTVSRVSQLRTAAVNCLKTALEDVR